ncbi:hypothetical protein O181_015529 [Austropuccinia psidii MF-1]|uniref:Uncharacterized protein n=1 Tax=Austropuccinia psidii MF-1 TaxID=1389203 RepID=A0A9Q3C036_9BASI|nr:hypothetical protein [Austropuccinia psidii MF-1]
MLEGESALAHPHTPMHMQTHPHTPMHMQTHPHTPMHMQAHPHTPMHMKTHPQTPMHMKAHPQPPMHMQAHPPMVVLCVTHSWSIPPDIRPSHVLPWCACVTHAPTELCSGL